jgi:hypothetical protein
MLRFEVFEVFLIGFVVWCFLVLSQLRIILLFRSIGLAFAVFAFLSGQHLPFLANHLGNLGEGKILPL